MFNHHLSWEKEFGTSYTDRRVLVTGATGFVGSHLCDALSALNADVYGISKTAKGARLNYECKIKAIDLGDFDAVRAAIIEIKPSVIFHLAGLVDTRQEMGLILPTLQNNLVSTIHLLMAVTNIGCDQVVIAGSSEEPNQVDGGIPTSPYAATKQAVNSYAQMFYLLYRTPVVVVRPFMSYGPRQSTVKVIPYTIVSLLSETSPKLSSGKRICDLIYVLDVVRGFLKAGTQKSAIGQVMDLGTGIGTPLREVGADIATLIGSSCSPVFGAIPDRLEERPQIAEIITARKLLSFYPQWSLQEGLIDTIEWYRNHIHQ